MRASEIIGEMTMKTGSYEGLVKYAPAFQKLIATGSHVGDIEQYKVYRDKDDLKNFAVFDGNYLIEFFQIDEKSILQAIYVYPRYRKQGLMSVTLFFLKNAMGFSKIILGDYHSNDTYEAVKRIYKRFQTHWEKDGQRVKYDPETVDQFYSLEKPTGWRLVLENDGIFEDMQYFEPMKLGTWYFNLLDA